MTNFELKEVPPPKINRSLNQSLIAKLDTDVVTSFINPKFQLPLTNQSLNQSLILQLETNLVIDFELQDFLLHK